MKNIHSTITTTKVKDCLIVNVGEDLSDVSIEEIKRIVLNDVHSKSCAFVIFELSTLDFLDTFEFEELKEIVKMTSTLGAEGMLVGLKPGIVHHLVSRNMNTSGIPASLNLNDALNKFGITTKVFPKQT